MNQQSLFTTPKRRSRKRSTATKPDPLWACVFQMLPSEWASVGPSLDQRQAVSQASPGLRRECVTNH